MVLISSDGPFWLCHNMGEKAKKPKTNSAEEHMCETVEARDQAKKVEPGPILIGTNDTGLNPERKH